MQYRHERWGFDLWFFSKHAQESNRDRGLIIQTWKWCCNFLTLMSFQMSMSHSYYTFFSIDSPGNQTIVSRSQTFRLTTEDLESMVAFICQDPPMSDMSNNQSQFVLFSVTFRAVEYRHNKTLCKTLWHILKILCRKLEIFYILLKIQFLVDPDKRSSSQL